MGSPGITTLFSDLGGVLLSNGWDRVSRKQQRKSSESILWRWMSGTT